jgi:hypothetical protein
MSCDLLLGDLLAGNALQGAVVLGPAGKGGLDEIGALLRHVRRDALGNLPEVALEILGAHGGLGELALQRDRERERKIVMSISQGVIVNLRVVVL